MLHAGRIVPVYPLTAGLTGGARCGPRSARRSTRPGTPTRSTCRRRSWRRSGSCRSPGPSRRRTTRTTFEGRDAALRAARLRRAAGPPARHGPAAAPAGARRGAGRDRWTRPPTRRSGPRSSTRSAARVGAADRADRRPGRARWPRSATTSPGRRRCCASSRATSARARPRWPRTPSPPTARAGLQGALLAPTDLLARQHLETVGALLEGVGIGVTLLTGSLKARRQGQGAGGDRVGPGARWSSARTRSSRRRCRSPTWASWSSTSSIVSGSTSAGQLEAKAGGRSPHVLLMTATPIPRTLGQVLYADLDVSDLRTPPAGRVQIRTGIRRPNELDGTWRKVREEAALGHSTFVVVPLDRGGRRREPRAPSPPRPRRSA